MTSSKPKSSAAAPVESAPRRALIVGGGSGLGLASSLALVAQGWRVFITGRNSERLAHAAALHPAGSCQWAAGDATQETDVLRVMDACFASLGGLEALVISAGQGGVGSVLQTDVGDFERVMRASVLPVFLFGKAAVPRMGSSGGAICAIASVTASMPQMERIAYCGAKAAVVGMVRQMALDLASRRIRVNAVSPSLVLTELSLGVIAKAPDPEELLAARTRSHPIGRLGTADEVGQAVAWLCSDAAGWITGQDLVMDGGLSLTAAVPR